MSIQSSTSKVYDKVTITFRKGKLYWEALFDGFIERAQFILKKSKKKIQHAHDYH